MDEWEPHFHWGFLQEHVLLPSLVLRTFPDFMKAVLLMTFLCLWERLTTFLLDIHWAPQIVLRSKWRRALWKTALYWVAMFLRLSYMLAAMTFHVGLLLVIVTALASGQFLIEYWKLRDESLQLRDDDEARVSLMRSQHSYPLDSVTNSRFTRPRSKSKPQGIFIHPADSNIARADAVALQLGVSGDVDHTKRDMCERVDPVWEPGEGRSKARQLLGDGQGKTKVHKVKRSFLIGEPGSESELSES